MNDEELVAVLEDAGLSPYQAEAYVTLLGLGTASATDVADASGVPDPRIYDVLRDLEEKGYVETFQQDSLTARANDPRDVRDDLESRSSRFLDAADAIEDRWSKPAAIDHELTVVKRFETILEQAKRHVRDADVQVTAAMPSEHASSIAEDLAVAHENGALVRLTVSTAHPDDDVPDPSTFEGVGTEVRHRPTPAPFLLIVDRTWSAYMPTQETPPAYGLIVDDSAHSTMFQWVFATVLWGGLDVLYRGESDDPPRSYVDIRRCLADLTEPHEAGATVVVDVTGRIVETGEQVNLSGVVRSLNLGWNEDDREVDPIARPSGPLSLTIETSEGETYEVGGWGSVLEDVEATRITVTNVSYESP